MSYAGLRLGGEAGAQTAQAARASIEVDASLAGSWKWGTMSGEKIRRDSRFGTGQELDTRGLGASAPQSGTMALIRSATEHEDRSSPAASEDIFRQVHATLARSEECLARTRTRLERARRGKRMEDISARLGQARFDVRTAVDVLEKLAQIAADSGGCERQLEPAAPIVAAAAGLLVDAKAWLEKQEKGLHILEAFPGEVVLVAHSKSGPMDLDTLVAALRSTAIALVQMGKLRDLRPE